MIMERQVQEQAGLGLSGARISEGGNLNISSLSAEQRKILTRIGAAALVAAGVIAPKNAEAVTLIQLNDNGLNGLRGYGSFWNGGPGSAIGVEKFTIDSPYVLTEASAIANLRIGSNNYSRPITDPQWQTFRILFYRDVNGIPESWVAPSYQIAVDSSMVQLTQTSLVDNNNQYFYKVRIRFNQLIDQPGTYHMGIAFDGTRHSGSANPGFITNMDSLVPFGDPLMSLGTNNGTWAGIQYPGSSFYANLNLGLEGQPVPEPGTFWVVLAGVVAVAGKKIAKALKRT
jgi:hypothetical protein